MTNHQPHQVMSTVVDDTFAACITAADTGVYGYDVTVQVTGSLKAQHDAVYILSHNLVGTGNVATGPDRTPIYMSRAEAIRLRTALSAIIDHVPTAEVN